jgi:multiple sugar transport system permease protein
MTTLQTAGHRGESVVRRRRKISSYVVMSAIAVVFLFPLVFMFMSSFKPDGQILSDVDSARAFLPVGDVSLDNYFGVFDRVPVGRFLFNSILITVLTVGLGLIVNSMGATSAGVGT